MIKLDVYISIDCWTCQETERIVSDVASQLPDVTVEMIDLNEVGDKPDGVFAVPTYVINGRIVSLGNPTREELVQKIECARS
jgi:alkyl hydroperoxide reductase subunit AhpF